jgi:hypothetical protein
VVNDTLTGDQCNMAGPPVEGEPDHHNPSYWASIGDEFAREARKQGGDSSENTGEHPERGSAGSEARSKKAASSVPTPFPLIAIRDVQEIVKQDWLIEPILPRFNEGSAGYIFGPEKTRKSMLLADFALSVTTGTPALGYFAVRHTGAAAGFFAEDAKGETSRRIQRLARARGVAVPQHLWLIDVPSLSLDDPEHQKRLMVTLTRIDNLKFIWLDPFVRLHHVDDNRANELAPIHTFLRVLSRECPQAVLALSHHANKLGASRGSTDFPAFGDFNLFLRRLDGHTTEVFRIDNRGGPPGQPFRYCVEDGQSEAGPTMKLVVADAPSSAGISEKEASVEDAIRAFKASHPDGSQRQCLQYLRDSGLGLKNDRFAKFWKRVQP